MSKDKEPKIVEVPGGKFSLRKALRNYFMQRSTLDKLRAFLTVFESLPLYLKENGREKEARRMKKLARRYFKLLGRYEWAFRWGIPKSADQLRNKLIDMEADAMGLIEPKILAEEIAIAVGETEPKPEPIPKEVLA